MNTRLTKIKDTEILSAVPESGHVMAEVDGVVKRVPGNKVGGVPDGAKEHQYLAADKNGKAKWRDPLAYKFDKPQTQYIDADGDINILCKVSNDIPEPPSEEMGYVIVYDNAQQEATGYIAFDDDGGYSLFENYMVVVKKAGAELPGHAGVVFPETGIYMQKIIGYWHTQQVTWDGFSISWDGVTENVQPMPANGLAENPAPYKQLVTDADGKTVWEDRIAWKESKEYALLTLDNTQEVGSQSVPDGWTRTQTNMSLWEYSTTLETVGLAWVLDDLSALVGNVVKVYQEGSVSDYTVAESDVTDAQIHCKITDGCFLKIKTDGTLTLGVEGNADTYLAAAYPTAIVAETIKPIDPPLIGGWKALGEGEPVRTVIWDNVSVNIVDKQCEEGVEFTIREDAMCYYVTFDGTKYECKPQNSEYGVFIGSNSLWSSGSVVEGEEPFACGEYAFFAAVDGTHTVSIVCEAAEILHVPDKYLPDHLPDKWANNVYEQDSDATEDDLNALCDALASGKYKLVFWGGMQIKDALSRGDGSFEFFVPGTGAHDYWRKYTAGSNGIYDINAGTYEPTQFRTAIDVGHWGRTSDGELAVFRSSYKKEKRISIVPEGIVLPSQTANSTKRFLITVSDDGTLSATEAT